MLRGKVLRSPYPHARILNVDTTRARALRGVKAVITGQDILPVKFGDRTIGAYLNPNFIDY